MTDEQTRGEILLIEYMGYVDGGKSTFLISTTLFLKQTKQNEYYIHTSWGFMSEIFMRLR